MKKLFTLLLLSISLCAAQTLFAQCTTITLADTVKTCPGDSIKVTATASLFLGDTMLDVHWAPKTGVSDTSSLTPTITTATAGYYKLRVRTVKDTNLVYNGDLSLGDTGFTSFYSYVSRHQMR
jgi:hypothetical protein